MKHMLGGVVIGTLVAGLMAAALLPVLPEAARRPWIVWLLLAVAIAGTLFLRRRRIKPPIH